MLDKEDPRLFLQRNRMEDENGEYLLPTKDLVPGQHKNRALQMLGQALCREKEKERAFYRDFVTNRQ
jgi:hypothetical protein